MTTRLPSLFVPHGGGPCFFIKPEDFPPAVPKDMWQPMATYLRGIPEAVGQRPKAVLVITGHWLTERPTFGNAERHTLLYDYYNFPSYTYELSYPAPGAPAVAARAAALLAQAGIASDMDDQRGIDHGVFIPLLLVYPDADIPIVPMSLQRGLNAAQHVAIGRALAQLRDEGVLIIGSGMSFHNMRALLSGGAATESRVFDDWLVDACTAESGVRDAALSDWERAPFARLCHPPGGEEHLIPLMVAAGAGTTDPGHRTFGERVGGQTLSGFSFG